MGDEVAATPIQLVLAMSAVANGGSLMRPMLVDKLTDRDGNVVVDYPNSVVREAIRDEAAKQMVEAVITVVSPNGTAKQAWLEDYVVAGKTGTAQKVSKVRRGYDPGKYSSSFIGFLPARKPELCIGVFVDEPQNGYYGGLVAGPAFKEIAEKSANYLGVETSGLQKNSINLKENLVLR